MSVPLYATLNFPVQNNGETKQMTNGGRGKDDGGREDGTKRGEPTSTKQQQTRKDGWIEKHLKGF